MQSLPQPLAGLRHLALYVQNFSECLRFYTEILGMKIEWQPDENNVYLTSGNDNLALHRASAQFQPVMAHQRLDHIGFIVPHKEQVNVWYEFLVQQQVPIKALPRDHRDGARSFYCLDPDGTMVQLIYHPPLAK